MAKISDNQKINISYIPDYRFIRLPVTCKSVNPIIHIPGKPLYIPGNIIFPGFNSHVNPYHGHNQYNTWA
jgi:hypothetical protein